MPTEQEIEAAAQAMRNSRAWPVAFGAGAARTLAVVALEAAERASGSTLERGNEIESEFYRLKAQEWAVEPEEAKRRITLCMAALTFSPD